MTEKRTNYSKIILIYVVWCCFNVLALKITLVYRQNNGNYLKGILKPD